MAKIAFSKLNKIKNIPDQTIEIDGNIITIKQYLPLEEKLDLILAVVDKSGTDEGFFNSVKLDAFYKIEMIKAYTNISFTDKQLTEVTKLYDAIILNKVWDNMQAVIPESEREYIWNGIVSLAQAITEHSRSIAGIMKTLGSDYSTIDSQLNDVVNKIKDPSALEFVKEFMITDGLSD